jgi:hypothetical protein
MKRQVDHVEKEMTKLKEKTNGFQENLDGILQKRLEQERKRNEQLLMAYSQLKLKYDILMKQINNRNKNNSTKKIGE